MYNMWEGIQKMKVRIVSDIHTEFYLELLPMNPEDRDTVLILAGDIGVIGLRDSLWEFLDDCAKRFNTILFVCGNHEFYNLITIDDGIATLKQFAKAYNNLIILENDTRVIDDIMFIGATLWTSLKHDPMYMFHIKTRMSDFKRIMTNAKDFILPEDLVARHDVSVPFIFNAVEEAKKNHLIPFVITHHAPSYKSIDAKYRTGKYMDDVVNSAFYSDLDQLIIDTGPEYWVHGHTHSSCRYTIEQTKVFCNPKGYTHYNKGPENTSFDPYFTISI